MEYCTKLHFPYLFHGKGGFPPEELPYHVHRRWWRHRDITNHGMQSGHVLASRKMGAQLCTGDFGQILHLFIAKNRSKFMNHNEIMRLPSWKYRGTRLCRVFLTLGDFGHEQSTMHHRLELLITLIWICINTLWSFRLRTWQNIRFSIANWNFPWFNLGVRSFGVK